MNIINLIGGGDDVDAVGDVDPNEQGRGAEFTKRAAATGELRKEVERNIAEEEANTNANAQTANKGEISDDKSGKGSKAPQNNAEPEETEEKGGIIDFLKKRTLKAAEAGEAERTTELPEGTYIMENIIRIGTVIIYIILLPLIPWYYVMKYSYRKMGHLYNNMFKPM